MVLSKAVLGSIVLAMALTAGPTAAQAPEVISNDSIVQMIAGKVPKDVILAKIHSTGNTFDVSANGLVNLTKSKVDRDVIKAMISAKTDSKEVLTNDAVVVMVNGNVAKDVIVFKIHSARSKFDLTAAGLVGLSLNKVPQDIVKAMLNVAESAQPEPPPPPPASGRAGSATAPGRGAPPAAAPASDASQGVTFTATGTMKSVYDRIRSHLSKAPDTTIQQTDPVLGQISAMHAFKDGVTEHESRVVIKVTSTSGHSSVRVTVLDKTRRAATPPGRWGVEKFDADQTAKLVTDLKEAVQGR